MTYAASTQRDDFRLISIASEQNALTNRILYYADNLAIAATEDEFDESRAQLGRAINRMEENHRVLLNGDAVKGIPKIMNEDLKAIYFDSGAALDTAVNRFLMQARSVYELPWGKVNDRSAPYIYVTVYGPHILQPLFLAAVGIYEAVARGSVEKIERIGFALMLGMLAVLICEAVYIFHPLEKRLKTSIAMLSSTNEALRTKVTEVIATRSELENARDRAERVSQAKSEFLSNMSHELRTPLNAIQGFTESLQYGVYGPIPDVRQNECLNDINAAARSLTHLVDDLLDISSLEEGHVRLNRSDIEIEPTLARALRICSDSIEAKDLTVDLAVDPGLPMIFADDSRLEQMVVNLLDNASKFTPENGHIKVSAGQYGTKVIVSVTDTGAGMTEKEIETALRRFGRSETSHVRHIKGTGIGLSLVNRLMELHDGVVDIRSEPGKGSSVSLVFPANFSPCSASVA